VRPLLLAWLLLPVAAAAQPYDPDFRWRTIDTEHFQIHFHQGEEALAQRVAGDAERAHARLEPLMGWTPEGRTQLVLSDDMDTANGMATTYHYSVIRLFAVPPSGRSELNDYRDWMQALVEHEVTHIFQLDNVGGLPRIANRVFGRFWFPNGLLPRWAIEGVAVLHESAGDPATGRNAGALYDMYARALVTEPPGLPPLEISSNASLDWPVGDVPYLLGGKLMELLQRRGGDAAIAAFFADQGQRIWPFWSSRSARLAFGEDFPTLWRELRKELSERYGRQLSEVRRRPVTASSPLTRRGAQLENPRWAPDGSAVAWLDRSLDERGGLRRATPSGGDLGLALPVDATGAFALRSATDAIVSIGEVWHELRYYEDLWRVDLATGERSRLTDGERATDPDVRPGGDVVVYVARTGGGEMELRRRRLGGSGFETLLARPGAQIFSPRISPDGARVAFELHENGRRDLALFEAGTVTRLTDDDALDLDPSWSPDGRWLLFASDRGGIFNLYARGEDGAIRQVTNVETGALEPEPAPDGKTLLFVGYSRRGYDLATMPFDPSGWMEPIAPPPARPFVAPADPPPLPSRPYSALSTVYPRWWRPQIALDAAGWTWGLKTEGADVLGRHSWQALGWYSSSAKQLGYSATYLGGWSWPLVDVWSGRTVTVSQGAPRRLEDEWTVGWPGATFTFTKIASLAFARAGWIGTLYRSLDEEPAAVTLPAANRFRDGFLSAATLSLGWTNGRRYVRSISAEEGGLVTADLQLAEPWMGTDYSLARARVVVAGYHRLPWGAHWAVAGRVAAGIARGSLGGRAPFRLGGLAIEELGGAAPPLLVLGGFDQLRGYRAGSLFGNGFLLANAELRFPLARLDRGRTTWPIYFRRLHGALFLDSGDAFDVGGTPGFHSHPLAADTIRVGVGAEVSVEVIAMYEFPFDLRFGIARGIGAPFGAWDGALPARDPAAATQAYLSFGPSF
jgi:Tol biopolymer transport system component